MILFTFVVLSIFVITYTDTVRPNKETQKCMYIREKRIVTTTDNIDI